MAQYGPIISSQDIRNSLLENKNASGRRVWSELYSNVHLASQQAESALAKNYAQNISSAYSQGLQQASAGAGSNLGSGYRSQYLQNIDVALQEAYDSYLQNYYTNLQTLGTNKNEAIEQISSLLNTQTENYSKLTEYSLNYLQWLSENYEGDLLTNDYWSEYFNNDGTPLTREDMLAKMFTTNEETGKQELTNKGLKYFDLVFNNRQSDLQNYSFGKYLSETDEDLFNWAGSQDLYNHAPNSAGVTSNLSSYKQFIGLDSADDVYDVYDNTVNYGTDFEIQSFVNSIVNDIDFKSYDIAKYDGHLDEIGTSVRNSIKSNIYSMEQSVNKLTNYTGMYNEESFNSFNSAVKEFEEFTNKYNDAVDKGEFSSNPKGGMNDKRKKSRKYYNDTYYKLYNKVIEEYNNIASSSSIKGYIDSKRPNYLESSTGNKYATSANKFGTPTYSHISNNYNMMYDPSIVTDATYSSSSSGLSSRIDGYNIYYFKDGKPIFGTLNNGKNSGFYDTTYKISGSGLKYGELKKEDAKRAEEIIKDSTGRDAKNGDTIILNGVLYVLKKNDYNSTWYGTDFNVNLLK